MSKITDLKIGDTIEITATYAGDESPLTVQCLYYIIDIYKNKLKVSTYRTIDSDGKYLSGVSHEYQHIDLDHFANDETKKIRKLEC